MKVAGLYLAAGKGSRMGKRKQDLAWTGALRMGGAGLEAMMELGLGAVAVVVRTDDPLHWLPLEPRRVAVQAYDREAPAAPWVIVPCEEAEQGLSHSLRRGLQALEAWAPDAVLVQLADQPFVTAEWLCGLLSMYRSRPGLQYAASGIGEAATPPAVLSWRMCADAMKLLTGDRGAGVLIASGRYAGRVAVPADPGMLFDVDTPEDLAAARVRAGAMGSIPGVE
ncbi:nucleotidyltransferase family protein [Gorillibacterium sp. sgz5001074]|uniref:nucleotidyltransferase family protein n=1 Tax=Gorillibacterium sp. sgz5001074 TaxID=3446695 RepID=UPI003F674A25